MIGAILNNPDDLGFSGRKPWLPVTVGILVAIGVAAYFFGDRKNSSNAVVAPVVPASSVPTSSRGVQPQTPSSGVVSPTTNPEAGGFLAKAKELDAQGNLPDARLAYLSWWHQSTNMAPVSDVEKRLAEINMTLLMNCAPMPENISYVIQKNDSISGISDRFGATMELTKKRNGIQDIHRIVAGTSLNIFTGRFSVIVSKSRNDMIVLMNDTFWKRYTVATGKFGKTPVGSFKTSSKDVNPTWYPGGRVVPFTGDPKGENILGTRWMTLRATGATTDTRGYGIHGTWDDSSLGTSASAGCVRMRNADVEELFMLLPIGTPVTINN